MSDPDDAVEDLRAENERLRQRVTDLELTVVEYRHQMSQVLGSASWRVTSPLRAMTARYRLSKVKARRAVKRLASGPDSGVAVRTSGLFPPTLTDLPETSPLRRFVDLNTLQRPSVSDRLVERAFGAPRVAVVAHVHYPELWADIEDRLVRIPETFDLFVSVTQGMAETAIPNIRRRHPDAVIDVVPNRGRDWGPLVRLVNRGDLRPYDVVAKVHTKKSEHRIDGDGWRLELLDGVLESPQAIERIIDLLTEDRSVGMVVPTGHVSGPESWGSDLGIAEMLASRLPMAFDPEELRFPAGSMFWCRPWLLDCLADLDLKPDDFEVEAGQYDGTTAHALERLVGVMTTVGGMDVIEAMDVAARLRDSRRKPAGRPSLLAFYLPQYHRTPENDEFWGEGFTDWDNVRRAQPLFTGHRQPLLPDDDIGYYDLSQAKTLREQAERARLMGVDGMVFYHYWFNGRRVLDRPLANLLADPEIELPFALCWANEPWTRRWDGLDQDVLIEQSYTDGWESRFYDDIRAALLDERYLRLNDRPILLVYRLDLVPDLPSAVNTWRHLAMQDGHPDLHVLGVLPSRDFGAVTEDDVAALDGLIAFPPGSGVSLMSLLTMIPNGASGLGGDVLSYDVAADSPAPQHDFKHRVPIFPTVFPGWDNTARRGIDAYVFHGSNRVTFRRWLQRASTFNPPDQPNLVFLNAWNEWAEGATIEGMGLPDVFRAPASASAAPVPAREAIEEPRRPYSTWLAPPVDVAETLAALPRASVPIPAQQRRIAVVAHVHYPELWDDIADRLALIDEPFDLWVSVTTRAYALTDQITARFPQARFVFPDGRGRDIAPLVMLVHDGLLDPYDVILKVHTKRSPHRPDGERWRLHLLDSLLPSTEGVHRIVGSLRAEGGLGVISADDCLGGPESWGDNLERVSLLAGRRGWALDPLDLRFPAGSMFWARADVLRDLAGFDIQYFEFEPELGQLDGTTAHAVERLIGVTALHHGYGVEVVSDALAGGRRTQGGSM